MHAIIKGSLFSLALVSLNVMADDVPAAMKKPVDATTTPAATTDRHVSPSERANNTSRNAVHDGRNAVSADQQGNDRGDIEITRRIRQSVVKEKGFSTDAHNIKIITNQGRVVLKGPVANNVEKARIEELAAQVAGREKMVSEIEVKAK